MIAHTVLCVLLYTFFMPCLSFDQFKNRVRREIGPCVDDCSCTVTSYSAFCNSANLTKVPEDVNSAKVRIIDLSDNIITSLAGQNIFRASRTTLQQLTMRNNKIAKLPVNILHGMVNLNDLDVSWNEITSPVTSFHFRTARKLDYLSLAHNKISCIENNSFASLTLLTELDLSYNDLTSENTCFPRDTICQLSNLIVLRISSNKLPNVVKGYSSDTGFLSCLKRLTNLQAANCGIETLSEAAFAGLDHMTSLDLSDNRIVTWPPGILGDAASLVYLDLGFNKVEKLPADFIKGCPNLSHLSLRNNELRSLDVDWLQLSFNSSSNTSTVKIDDAIRGIKSYLSLTTNTNLAHKELPQYSDDLWLDWSGNPWLCDCNMLPFVQWVITDGAWVGSAKGYHDVTCYDPADQRGDRLLDVYVTGRIDLRTVSALIDKCPEEIITTPAGAILNTTSRFLTRDKGQESTVKPTATQFLVLNTTDLSITTSTNNTTNESDVKFNHFYSDESEAKPAKSYTTIIILSVLADLVISVVILLAVKRWCSRKVRTRWATVVPASTRDHASIVSSTPENDVKLTTVSDYQ